MSELVISGLCKKFGNKNVLDNVNLKFEQGHCYGLLGRNGAGKSTLINIIMQRCSRKSGTITIDGKPIDQSDKLLSRIFCMNDSAVYPAEFKLKTIFSITASMYSEFDLNYATRLAELFGLDLKKRAGQLSTGYTTIYKVILAFASNADFIFLDEPVLGIDVNQRELFYKELSRKISESKSCFVISTHLIEEAQNLIEKTIILHENKIILEQDTEQLLSDYICISGRAELVDRFCEGKHIVGTESMGMFKSILIFAGESEPTEIPDGLSIDNVSLQKIFYYITGGSPESRK